MKRAVVLGRLRSLPPRSIFHETCPFSHPCSALFSLAGQPDGGRAAANRCRQPVCSDRRHLERRHRQLERRSFWSTGGAPNGSQYDVFIDGGKTGTASVVTMDGYYTVGRLTLDAGDTLNLADNIDFFINNGAFAGSGSLVNNGTINFNSTGSGIYRVFNGAGSISGTGTINFNGANDRVFAGTAGDTVTVGAGQTLAGQANLGNGGTNLTNQGTLTAN